MLRMNQIDEIKELQRQGLGPQEIAGRLILNRKTVAKYMKVEDFNGGLLGKKTAAYLCRSAIFTLRTSWDGKRSISSFCRNICHTVGTRTILVRLQRPRILMIIKGLGGHGVWWPLRTSNPARLLTKGLGGFDSHILPPPLSPLIIRHLLAVLFPFGLVVPLSLKFLALPLGIFVMRPSEF